MNLWIIGLLILGIAFPLNNGQEVLDDDDDYEIKRFHVQSRSLGGSPTCVETRRKRSVSQRQIDIDDTDEDDEEEEEQEAEAAYEGAPTANAEELEIQTDDGTDDGRADSEGILLHDSDLDGSAGILVIQNQASENSPILFELRPVSTDTRDKYYDTTDDKSSEPEDDAVDFEDRDTSYEVFNNNNRYKPGTESNTDDDSEEYEEASHLKRRRPTKKPKRKPSNGAVNSGVQSPNRKRRPTIPPKKNQRHPDRRRNPNGNTVKKPNGRPNGNRNPGPSKKPNRNPNRKPNRSPAPNKKRNPNNNRNGIQYSVGPNNVRNQHDNSNRLNKKRINNIHNSSSNKNNRFGFNINKNSGENTVSRTVTTTETVDEPDVNCIIINKSDPPAPTTERPFWNILGRSANEDRSFGLRKRLKNSFKIVRE